MRQGLRVGWFHKQLISLIVQDQVLGILLPRGFLGSGKKPHTRCIEHSCSWQIQLFRERFSEKKSARDNPKRYCGWFWVHCSSKKFERMALEAMDICLRVLKESNKSRFDGYSVRNSELIVSYITFRSCRVHIFSDNLPRNSCICIYRQLGFEQIGKNWQCQ